MDLLLVNINNMSISTDVFKYVRIIGRDIKILILNGKNYREYGKSNNWKHCCCFSNEECYNFQLEGTMFCKKHRGGIQNEKISTNEIGDIVEEHVFKLLHQCSNLSNIQNIGQENCKLDIIFKIDGESTFRGIQVKTLFERSSNLYNISNIDKYDNDTIIVAINLERNIYCIFNKIMIGIDTFCLNLLDINPRYREFCFYEINSKNSYGNTFLDLLNKWSKTSTIYSEDCFSETYLKEKLMTDALKIKCQDHNLKCESHSTSDSSIDCIVNDTINCQLKFSNNISTNNYDFSLHKTLNCIVKTPYSESDNIHFFIFAYINPLNQYVFYIIPTKVLIHYGYISTSTSVGKIKIMISPLEYQCDHWSKKFIDRFDLFTNEFDMNELIDLNDMFDRFQFECKKRNIICIRNMDDLKTKYFTINDKLCRYIESTYKHGDCFNFVIEKGGSKKPYNSNTDDIPDFFIFRIKSYPDHFWIIPKQKFIEEKIIGSDLIKGSTTINFPIPGNTNNRKKWLNHYLNNYHDLLKFETGGEI